MDAATEIRNLIYSWSRAYDAGDWRGLAALLARGVYLGPNGVELRGESIAEHFHEHIVLHGGRTLTRRIDPNVLLDVDEEAGAASARCAFVVFQQQADRVQPLVAGRSEDDFVLRDGRWCWDRRAESWNLLGDLSAHWKGESPPTKAPARLEALPRTTLEEERPDFATGIRNLVYTYSRHLDAADFDAYGALFENAVFDLSAATGAVAEGAVAVAQMLREGLVLRDDGTPGTLHMNPNVLLDIDASGQHATADTDYLLIQSTKELSLQAIMAGNYTDVLERVEGRWRFVRRTYRPGLVGPIAQHGRAKLVKRS